MATDSAPRTSRLDMRMNDARRDETIFAAEESATRLSSEAFEQFSAALDEGVPAEAQELLERRPVWE